MYKRLKKDTKWSILNLGSFDIDNIKLEVSKYLEEWNLDTSRQNLGSVHSATQMYRICETSYDWIPGTPIETFQRNSLHSEKAKEELLNIFNILENYYSGNIIRCEIIKLLPFSEILRHTDGGPILHYSRRVHIPIVTHPEITFTVMSDTQHFKEGGWYEINNQMPHSVNNPTEIERIHLIIDILPNEMLYLTKTGDINDKPSNY